MADRLAVHAECGDVGRGRVPFGPEEGRCFCIVASKRDGGFAHALDFVGAGQRAAPRAQRAGWAKASEECPRLLMTRPSKAMATASVPSRLVPDMSPIVMRSVMVVPCGNGGQGKADACAGFLMLHGEGISLPSSR